jgi:HK97 family phage major capsid protein
MPTLQELQTEKSIAIEKARAVQQRLEAEGRKDPSQWTPAEQDEVTNLVKAATEAKDRYNRINNLTNTTQILDRLEQEQDLPESERQRTSLGFGRSNDLPNRNIINWRVGKNLERTYHRDIQNITSTAEYDEAFAAYLRGNDRKMMDLKGSDKNEGAGMYSGNEEKGGYFFTGETWASEFIKNVDDEVYVQKKSRVIMLPNGSRQLSARTRRAKVSTFGWMGENTDMSDMYDTSLKYGKRTLTPHYLGGSVIISRDLLRNVPKMEGMVMEETAINAGEVLEQDFLTGNGNNKPMGLMYPSADGISTARDITSAATAFDFDDFVRMKYALKLKYRGRAEWMLHRYVLQATALLKSGDGQYLWQPSRQVGEPDRILGLPITETEWLPYAASSGLYFALLGDFSWYWIVYELTMEMQRLIEMRAHTNENEYLFRCKVDAQPMLEEAFVRGKRA